MPHKLYLVRHGATASTAANLVCGSSDVPLSPQGEAEMTSVARFLADKRISTVFSSPLQRARIPSQKFAETLHVDHRVIADLAELDFGKWEGLTFKHIALRWPLEAARVYAAQADYTLPGGENIGAFQVRAVRALEEIQRELRGPAAVYTHGGILRMIVGSLNKLSLPDAKALSFSTGSITVLDWDGEGHRVAEMNLYAHLSETQ
jgi:broad specificity phosphatase PhoE